MTNLFIISSVETYNQFITLNHLSSLAQHIIRHDNAKHLLEDHRLSVDPTIIACIKSGSIHDLSSLQTIRQKKPHANLMAIFDAETNIESARLVVKGAIASYLTPAEARIAQVAFSQDESVDSEVQPYSIQHNEQHDLSVLTRRQLDVIELIKQGKSNKQIAEILGISEGTTKVHCLSIYRALGVTNRTQAAIYFRQ